MMITLMIIYKTDTAHFKPSNQTLMVLTGNEYV